MSIRWVLAVGVGLVGGWAARSLADSPEGAGVKLLEIALKTKERVGRWAALEAERLEDMLAEARSTPEPIVVRKSSSRASGARTNGARTNGARANGAASNPETKGQSGKGRGRARPAKGGMQA
jgi:hypothetical protein